MHSTEGEWQPLLRVILSLSFEDFFPTVMVNFNCQSDRPLNHLGGGEVEGCHCVKGAGLYRMEMVSWAELRTSISWLLPFNFKCDVTNCFGLLPPRLPQGNPSICVCQDIVL